MTPPRPTSGAPDRSRLRVGVDVVSVDEVETSIRTLGDRYLRRLYTPHELESCTGSPRVRAERLAARFAAKEAAVKVLRPQGPRPEWRSIEVRRAASGACDLHLTGSAARLAEEAGLSELAVSLTHEGDAAAAVVVALAPARPVPPHQESGVRS